jgi:hypothetical protein
MIMNVFSTYLTRPEPASFFMALSMMLLLMSLLSSSSLSAQSFQDEQLRYFWLFDTELPNNTELESINATFPLTAPAVLEYESALPGYPETDRRASLERRNRPTPLNYRPEANAGIPFEEVDMRAIQVRQPFTGANGENTIILNLPTIDMQEVVLSFAAMDEGAAEGLIFEYSVSPGDTPEWTTDGLPEEVANQPLLDEYQLYTLDFSSIEAAKDNPDFRVRIRFEVADGELEDGSRVTFNNMAFDATPLENAAEAITLDFEAFPASAQANYETGAVTVAALTEDGLTDIAFEGDITLSLESGPAEPEGTLTQTAENGVAVFDDLSFSQPGSYVLRTESAGLESALTGSIQVAAITEVLMPAFIQGNQDANGDNNDRIPFVYRVTIEGLIPDATYRFGNRIVTPEDPLDQDGAGNAIFVKADGEDFIRTTDSPRFRDDDLNARHGEFTADAEGRYTGWFITEPSGNDRFTPGNQLFMRILTNNGAGGEERFFTLTTSTAVSVIPFGTTSGDGSGLLANTAFSPQNLVMLYDNDAAEGRPLASTVVEATGAQVDDRYAFFYENQVAGNDGFFGAIIPNDNPDGIRAIAEFGLQSGEMEQVLSQGDGIWDGISTINPDNGLTPLELLLVDLPATPELLSPEDGLTEVREEDLIFTWTVPDEAAEEILYYTLEISTSEEFDEEFIDLPNITDTTADMRSFAGLFAGGTSYFWRVKSTSEQADSPWSASRSFTTAQVVSTPDEQPDTPAEFALHANYPNPFNPTTSIRYDLPKTADVELSVYNLAGQRVATLVSGTRQAAGTYQQQFDASALSSGVYIYRLEAGRFTQTRKMMLVK